MLLPKATDEMTASARAEAVSFGATLFKVTAATVKESLTRHGRGLEYLAYMRPPIEPETHCIEKNDKLRRLELAI
jgi:hypothetical protein